MKRTIYHNDKQELVELFVGKSVKRVNENELELSDGTRLFLYGNSGCGGCSAGNFHLTELNGCENIITNVEVDEDECDWRIDERYDQKYTLFVYTGHQKINLATFKGGQDNGYYGTGFEITVKRDHG